MRSELTTVHCSLTTGKLLLDDAEDFFLAHDQELLAVELDLGARVLAEQNLVARLHVQREDLTFVIRLALADADHFAFLGLLFGAVGDDDAPTDGFALFHTADEDAVMKRCKRGCCCHCFASPSPAERVTPAARFELD